MPNRASQFAPFDALKGFYTLLKEEETDNITKKELLSDWEDVLNENLRKIKIGDLIIVKYYYLTDYLEVIGYLKKIDNVHKYLIISNTKILFSDIINIEKKNCEKL